MEVNIMKFTSIKHKTDITLNGEVIKVEYPLSTEDKQIAISIALEASKTLLDPSTNDFGRRVYSRLTYETILFGLLTLSYATNLNDIITGLDADEVGVQEFYDFLKHSGITSAVLKAIPKDEYDEIVHFADDAFEKANNVVTSGAVVLENFLSEAIKVMAGMALTQQKTEE